MVLCKSKLDFHACISKHMPRKTRSQGLADARSLLVAYEHALSQDIRYALASVVELRRHLRRLIDERGTDALHSPRLPLAGTIGAGTLARAYFSKWPLARYEAPAPNGSLADVVVDIAARKMPPERGVPCHIYSAAALCVKAELHRALEHMRRSAPVGAAQRIESTKLSRAFTVRERDNFAKYGARKPLHAPDSARTWKDVLKALGSAPDMQRLSHTVRLALQATAQRLEEMYGTEAYDIDIKPMTMHCAEVSDAGRARHVLEKALEDAAVVDELLPRYSFGPAFDTSILHESYEDYMPAGDDAPNGLRHKDQLVVDAMMLSSGDEGDDSESSESEYDDTSDDSMDDASVCSVDDTSGSEAESSSPDELRRSLSDDLSGTDTHSTQPRQRIRH